MDEENNYNNEYFEKQRFEEERREEEAREEENRRIENEKQRYEEEGIEYEKQENKKRQEEEEQECKEEQRENSEKEMAEKERKQQFPNSNRGSFAPDKSDFFDVNLDRISRLGRQNRKETIPGKTNGGDAAVVGLIAIAFIFTHSISWLAVVAGIGGGILAVLSWQKGYRAFRLYASFALNAGGIVGGLIAYFTYLFG